MKREPDIRKGSVLALPLGEQKWALGQVIEPGVDFYIGFSTRPAKEPLAASDIVDQPLQIFSWTNDAEVFRGNWKNLGVHKLQFDGHLPEYKVYLSGVLCAESFDGKHHRAFDPNTDLHLAFRKTRSPLLVQDLVQAAIEGRES